MPSTQAASVRVRFADGAPFLETLIAGTPENICSGASAPCYLQVDGSTVASSFSYGTITSFLNLTAGTHSLVARDDLGYAVGPMKTAALAAGKRYTLIVVGTYPNYSVLTFEEPASSGDAQLSLYEASPAMPQAEFGSFSASGHSGFKQLGSAKLGSVATVDLGKSVSNFGGYVGKPSATIGTATPQQLNAFDRHNVLPFHVAARLSLFLFDAKPSTAVGPVFGSLDK